MDYKEEYENALERCKKEFNFKNLAYSPKEIKQRLERVFPELKENEDERIRKECISIIDAWDKACTLEGDYCEVAPECIAWLEKQGERKQNVTDIISDLENYFAATTKEQQEKDWEEIKKWEEKHFNHNNYIEQNPTDKVETKFKVGDWIISSEGTLRHIVAVDKTGYETDKGWLTHDYYENCFHLWTIKDAKDGDVLYYKSPSGIEYIVMSSGVNRFGNVDSYFRYNSVDGFGISVPSVFNTKEDITPATKEQRDLLFTKMKEAGYKWDAEKKELKKIEQKSTWSEEDEKGLGDTLWAIQQARTIAKDENDMGNLWYAENWLKSLKERMKGE